MANLKTVMSVSDIGKGSQTKNFIYFNCKFILYAT